MARLLKLEDYTDKRNEILDVVQRLIYTKGYEQMTVQDILTELKISKGAFYHYFDSKPALLEALIQRIQVQMEQVLMPVIEDEQLSALEKLDHYFSVAFQWKIARKELMMELLAGWYVDDNAIVRQKMVESSLRDISVMISKVIRQGVAEGTLLADPRPEQMAEIFLSLVVSLGEIIARLVLSHETCADDAEREAIFQRILVTSAAYNVSIERLLGIPAGSMKVFDVEKITQWLTPVTG